MYFLAFSTAEKGRLKFSRQIAAFFGIEEQRVFLFGAARMGLYSVLKSMGFPKGDEVIVAGYTCVVVTNAIKYAGMKAVYADINVSDLNIRTQDILDLVNKRTRAVVITHNFGITYEDTERIRQDYPELLIIEDAAHTLASYTSSGKRAGLLGDASFFSLEYSKPLTTGMGGFLIINNPVVRDRMELFYSTEVSDYSHLDIFRIIITLKIHFLTSYKPTIWIKWGLFRVAGWLRLIFKTRGEELKGERPGKYPVHLAGDLSFLGYLQLKDIEKTIQQKREICLAYENALQGISGIKTYYLEQYDFVRYPVVFDEHVSSASIRAVRENLRNAGFAAGEWFNDVVHPLGSYRYCYEDGVCPVGEAISKRILNLPVNIHARLNKQDLSVIRQIFLEILR